MIVQPNETSLILNFVIRDTAGARMTGIAFNTAGLVAEYRHSDEAVWTAISLTAGTLGTWGSGQFVEDSFGLYQLGVPDAAIPDGKHDFGTDYSGLIRLRGVTDMEPVEIRLDARGIPTVSAGTTLSFGNGGGLPVIAEGSLADGTVLPYAVRLQASTVSDVVEDVAAAAGGAKRIG